MLRAAGRSRMPLTMTHMVDEARFVSSCFSCPSSANPRFDLLLARRGLRKYTLERVKPADTGHPSSLSSSATEHLYWAVENKQMSAN